MAVFSLIGVTQVLVLILLAGEAREALPIQVNSKRLK
jgi:hypothetical protein